MGLFFLGRLSRPRLTEGLHRGLIARGSDRGGTRCIRRAGLVLDLHLVVEVLEECAQHLQALAEKACEGKRGPVRAVRGTHIVGDGRAVVAQGVELLADQLLVALVRRLLSGHSIRTNGARQCGGTSSGRPRGLMWGRSTSRFQRTRAKTYARERRVQSKIGGHFQRTGIWRGTFSERQSPADDSMGWPTYTDYSAFPPGRTDKNLCRCFGAQGCQISDQMLRLSVRCTPSRLALNWRLRWWP